MKGHLRKQARSKKWFGVYREPGAENPTWRALSESRRESEKMLTAILKTINDETYVARSKQTFGQFLLDDWLPGTDLKPSTAANYRTMIDAWIMRPVRPGVPALGSVKLQSLTPDRLKRFYSDLATTGRRRDGQGLSPKTVRNLHVLVHKALADAYAWDRVSRNVASKVKPPKVERTEMHVWDADQLRTFLGHVRDDRLYAAWHLIAMTGVRRAEVLGLRWADFDVDAGRLRIVHTATLVGGRIVFGSPKTDAGRRTMSIDPGTVAVLREHRKRGLEERLQWGEDYRDEGLMFTMEDGTPINPETFSDAFTRHAKAAGLPPIRLHDLRHSYATAALTAGIPAKVVSERLGHAGIAITLDRYSHVLPSVDEHAAATVANLILGTG